MKKQKRSIVDLMNHPTPEQEQVEAAVEKVHLLATLPNAIKWINSVKVDSKKRSKVNSQKEVFRIV